MSLVLSRQVDESIVIGDDITVTVFDIRGENVRLGVSAPSHIPVHRREVYDAIRREHGDRSSRARCILASLPPDVSDSYEQFKLSILKHKITGWQEISRQDVIDALTALTDLARSEAA